VLAHRRGRHALAQRAKGDEGGLDQFFQSAKLIPLEGVFIPLKSLVVPFLD